MASIQRARWIGKEIFKYFCIKNIFACMALQSPKRAIIAPFV